MRVFASLFLLLLVAGLVPAKEFSRLPALSAGAEVGPVSSPETDPRIIAIRARQAKALARGDRDELKQLEGEVQAILLSRQPPAAQSELQLRVVLPEARPLEFDGPDAVIDTGTFFATAADYMMDGRMYVAAYRADDTVCWLYGSTDHGSTWQRFSGYFFRSGGQKVPVRRVGLCVGEGDSAFVYMFMGLGSPFDDLYQVRIRLDGSGGTYFNVRVGADTVSDFAVCRDYTGSNYWLYAVAVNGYRLGARNSYYLRSADYGKSWAVTDSGNSDVHPHYSFGAGSWLYHALEGPDAFAKGEVWLFHNPMFGASGEWKLVVVQPDTFSVRDPVIAPAFTLPESSTTVWALFSHDYEGSGDWDIINAWSTSGGRTWDDWNYLATNNGVLERFPDLRNYASSGNNYINGSYIHESGSGRAVYRRFSNSGDPGTWSDTLRVNSNSAATGRLTRPLLVYSPGGPGTGAGCVFVGEGLRNLYFNSPWLTALAEARGPQVNPRPRTLLCRGVFEWPGGSFARLFDAAGRPVAPVRPGINDLRRLPAGVYQILEPAGRRSLRVVIAR